MQPEQAAKLNIAVLDKKDFPDGIAPLTDMFVDWSAPSLGPEVLFEQSGLVKTTGFDLCNFPLTPVLKIRVYRRAPSPGTPNFLLWHAVLPLPSISRYLTVHPYEWETWLGLMPNSHQIDSQPAETSFQQELAVISRPDFPKLRLKVTYTSPQHIAQNKLPGYPAGATPTPHQADRKASDIFGKAVPVTVAASGTDPSSIENSSSRFAGYPSVTYAPVESVNASSSGGQAITPVHSSAPTPVAPAVQPIAPVQAVACARQDQGHSSASISPALLAAANELIDSVRNTGENWVQRVGSSPATQKVPPPLETQAVLGHSEPEKLISTHAKEISQYMQALTGVLDRFRQYQASEEVKKIAAAAGTAATNTEDVLLEGLTMAMMGMLENNVGAGEGRPRTVTNLSSSTNERYQELQTKHPKVWDACYGISQAVNERSTAIEKERQMLEENERLKVEVEKLQQSLDGTSGRVGSSLPFALGSTVAARYSGGAKDFYLARVTRIYPCQSLVDVEWLRPAGGAVADRRYLLSTGRDETLYNKSLKFPDDIRSATKNPGSGVREAGDAVATETSASGSADGKQQFERLLEQQRRTMRADNEAEVTALQKLKSQRDAELEQARLELQRLQG